MNRFVQVRVFAVVSAFTVVVFDASDCRAQKLLQFPHHGNPVLGTLTTEQTDPQRWVLTAGGGLSVAMRPHQNRESQYWTLAPVGRDLVRIQLFARGRLWSLSVDRMTGRVGFSRSAESVDQLWRMISSKFSPGALRFESVAFVGNCLAGQVDSAVTLQPASDSAAQFWYFDAAPPPPTIEVPIQRLVTATVRPNPPLDSVQTRLVNSDRSELLVRITDLRAATSTDVRIPPGGFHDIEIDRDAGATFIEKYEVVGPTGPLLSQQFVTPVPPSSLYDVSVYQKFLQSIAIDRTGKSPDPIEDVNFQAKSMGFFVIPAGDRFRGGELDVIRLAKQAANPGGVRSIAPDAFNRGDERVDPLEQVIRELPSK
jgi:hypothetical protein